MYKVIINGEYSGIRESNLEYALLYWSTQKYYRMYRSVILESVDSSEFHKVV